MVGRKYEYERDWYEQLASAHACYLELVKEYYLYDLDAPARASEYGLCATHVALHLPSGRWKDVPWNLRYAF